MSTKVQFRRGTTTEHSTFTGAVGELTVDTTKDTVVIHDGTTAGGYPQMRENGSQNLVTTGTATAASFIPTSSTVPTNGVYLPTANSVAISTNGTKRIEIQADGDIDIDNGGVFYDATNNRLAIGTTSPGEQLEVHKSSGSAQAWIHSSGGGGILAKLISERSGPFRISAEGGSASGIVFETGNSVTPVERARIDTSGRLLVGTSTTASNAAFQVQGVSGNSSVFGVIRAQRGSTPADGEELGYYTFGDKDSANSAATIIATRDGGTWTSGTSMPTRLTFNTCANGASTPTERLRIDSTGLVTLAGPGIKFPATQVTSADANVLDDYEEGTWTPSISNAYNSPPTVTYTAQTGTYTKIGRVVTAAFHIDIASFSGGVGPVFFSGLPFAPATTTDSRFQCAVYLSGVNTPASTVSVNLGYAKADNGTYYLVFNCVRDDTAMANAGMLVTGDFAAGDVIGGTFTYFV